RRTITMPSTPSPALVVWLQDLGLTDVPSVGGKNASLGELLRELGVAGVRVPNGFATTAAAWRAFVRINDIERAILGHLEAWRTGQASLADSGHAIRALVLAGSLPDDLAEQVRTAYARLADLTATPDPAVAV